MQFVDIQLVNSQSMVLQYVHAWIMDVQFLYTQWINVLFVDVQYVDVQCVDVQRVDVQGLLSKNLGFCGSKSGQLALSHYNQVLNADVCELAGKRESKHR